MATILTFMESPLVTWVRTFNAGGEHVDFQELCDGAFLNDVMLQIDQRDSEGAEDEVKRVAKDTNARIHNWSLLIRCLHNYYKEVLQQLVVMEIPDVVHLVKEPTKDRSLEEMKRTLLLLLGCAVQCARKEHYINIIKSLDLPTQQALASCIQEVTEFSDNVLPLTCDLEIEDRSLINIVNSIQQERNKYADKLFLLTQEKDYYQRELSSKRGTLTPPAHLEKYHLVKELADWKNKCHSLTRDTEERLKVVSDLKDELEEIKGTLSKAKLDNLCLSKDAKAARAYRDELDILREKAMKADKYEKEVSRYKEKMNELDFYKARVQELRKDSDVVAEARVKMEEQLAAGHKKTESIMDELVHLQLQLEQSNLDKEQLNRKLQEVIEENSALEFERSKRMEGYGSSGNIRRILSCSSTEFLHGTQQQTGHSISDELNDTMVSKVTMLEMENDELKHDAEDARQRLADAQRQLERARRETDAELEKHTSRLEHQAKALKTQLTMELSKEHQAKIAALEEQSRQLKNNLSSEYQQSVSELERRNAEQVKELRGQLRAVQDSWARDKLKQTQAVELNHQSVGQLERRNLETQQENLDLHQKLSSAQEMLDEEKEHCEKLLQQQQKHQQSVGELERKNAESTKHTEDLSRQLQRSQEAWSREQEARYQLEAQNRECHESACQIRAKASEEAQQRIEELNNEVRSLQEASSKDKQILEHVDKKSQQYQRNGCDLEKKNQECQQRVEDLQKQLYFVQEAWSKDKDHNGRLEKQNHDLVAEKEQFKQRLQMIQESSNHKIQQLEQTVDELQTDHGELKRSNERIGSLCDNEINKDNAGYAAVRQASQELSQGPRAKQPLQERMNMSSSQDTAPSQYDRRARSRSSSVQSINNNNNPPDPAGQEEDFSDILRKHHTSTPSVPGAPPSRPATVLGVAHEHRANPPIRGIVTPQRRAGPSRSVPVTPESYSKENTFFDRSDKMRATTLSKHAYRGGSNQSISEDPNFIRGHNLRASMPVRKTGYVAPERRGPPSSSRTAGLSPTDSSKRYKQSHGQNNGARSHGSHPPNEYYKQSSVNGDVRGYVSDKDSGCATSPESPTSPSSIDLEHLLTSFRVYSSETKHTQVRTTTTTNPRVSEKWGVFVEKIVELQDKNQKLIGENSELRKVLNSLKFSSERAEHLEEKILTLEVENKKLRKICESLSGTNNPYDKRTYHFYSNV